MVISGASRISDPELFFTEHVAHIVEETLVGEDGKCKSEKAALPEVDVSLEDIVTRIRHIVLTLRLRVSNTSGILPVGLV